MNKKRFKSKKKMTFLPIILFFTFIYGSFTISFHFLFQKFLLPRINNDTFTKYLIHNSFGGSLTEDETILNLMSFGLKDPGNLLRYSLGFKKVETAWKEEEEDDYVEGNIVTDYVNDPNPVDITKPIIYIYNSHQLENYSMENLAPYNIKPNVLMASYVLREKLNDRGLATIVETTDISELLRINNWKYSASYKASRLLLEDAKTKYPTLKFFIDLHRDSSVRERTTTQINGISYAKVMFVVGKEHANYQKNLDLANTLNELIKKEDPSLSRGVLGKEGKGVNGIYNQDISPNSVLIELGGQYNTIEEATNTIDILVRVLASYLGENI